MKVIACIEEREAIDKILKQNSSSKTPSSVSSIRAPPRDERLFHGALTPITKNKKTSKGRVCNLSSWICEKAINIYLIEQNARNNRYTSRQRYELRLQQARPILDELKNWLDKTIKTTVPQSELGKALNYMHVRWDELTAYLLDGCLEIDNNLVENLIRPFALGRKNWMMSGSPRGAHASALFYSLIATAKANGLNPFHYLKTLFENIRSCRTAEDYKDLLPFNLAGSN